MELALPLRFLHPETPPHHSGRLAVIDIGSSSIRLVVYEDVANYPYMMLNQKVWVALGEGKGDGPFTIAADRMERACDAIEWFLWVAKEARARAVLAIATSAVREADNGHDFAETIRRRTGLQVNIIDGEAEARLSAIGACVSIPDAHGLVVDLGGGSLELYDTTSKQFESLPLGVLSLKVLSEDTPTRAAELLYQHIHDLRWPEKAKGSIVAIGSGMRAIAKMHMDHVGYPLKILHDYHLPKPEGLAFCEALLHNKIDLKSDDMRKKTYREVMPYRAAALHALLRLKQVHEVRFATFGLREGVLFSQVGDCPIIADPLLAFAADWADREGLGADAALRQASWIRPFLPDANPRWLQSACLMGQVVWREQQAYRARTAFDRVLGGAYVAADHPTRAMLALAVYHIHENKPSSSLLAEIQGILTPVQVAQARQLGALVALTMALDPGGKGLLNQFELTRGQSGHFNLQGPSAFMGMKSEEVEKRLNEVQAAFDASV
jgi:exopolyphosphatase/guanosine-5'-triphosphate,3'-diphosphate pyrophosphatase